MRLRQANLPQQECLLGVQRGGEGVSSLSWLIRDYLETVMGRIMWCDFIYLFLPAPPRKTRLSNCLTREWSDADGRPYSLFKGRGAYCPNVEMWRGKYPLTGMDTKPHYIVSAAECKACKFHEKARRRRACYCLWDREQRKGSPTPAQIAADAVREAQKMVNE
jgi:hypothetical protein